MTPYPSMAQGYTRAGLVPVTQTAAFFDSLVPHWPLADFLGRFQPGPIPHEELLGSLLSTIS